MECSRNHSTYSSIREYTHQSSKIISQERRIKKTRITLDLHSPSQKIQPVRRSSGVISIRINPYNDRSLRVGPWTRILRFTKDTCSLFILVVQSGTIFSSPISIFFSNRQPVARRRTIFCCLDYGGRLFRANQFSQWYTQPRAENSQPVVVFETR